MIVAFLDLHPGELLYSGYARCAYRLRYPNLKNVTNELFGNPHIIASVPFASHLQYFVAHQPVADRFTTDSLIAEHTLLPFYAPFLPPNRIQRLHMDMCSTNGPGIYMRVGLMASIVPSPEYLQYCPECAKEDQTRFGEMYWHRQHQVPGVFICHIHNVWLEQSNVRVHNRKPGTSLLQLRRPFGHCVLPERSTPHLAYVIPSCLLPMELPGFFSNESFRQASRFCTVLINVRSFVAIWQPTAGEFG